MKKAERKKLNAYVLIVKEKIKYTSLTLAFKVCQRSMSFRHWRTESYFCVLNTEKPWVNEYYEDRCTL